MDQVKEAFKKVKQDIDDLKEELNSLKEVLSELTPKITQILEKKGQIPPDFTPTDQQTNQHINPTDPTDPTHNPTHNYPLKPLKPQNMGISSGNEGVPTDKQTNRQTNQHIPFDGENTINNAAEILNSLDSIKKDIRLKFKRLTDQEFLVFSTLYQLDEERGSSDYKELSQRLKLSESSIRDYVGRIIKKGIPVDKTKINNKTIKLSISQNLKKIATLPTILQLRDI